MEWSVSPKYSENGKNGVFRYMAIDLHAEVLKKIREIEFQFVL